MKTQPDTEQLNRLCWLTSNDFILRPNYEWHHISENVMIKQSLVETAPLPQWDRLIESIEYFCNND